jgi:hypothetical protein
MALSKHAVGWVSNGSLQPNHTQSHGSKGPDMRNSTPNLGDGTFCGMAGYKASATLLGTEHLSDQIYAVDAGSANFRVVVVTIN